MAPWPAWATLGFLSRLRPVSAAEAPLEARTVRLHPEIEPLVRWLEVTPRERVLEGVAERIRRGLTYRELLAALLLAGVRNIQPRPVGFKFHAVLVVNSAHLASLASPDTDRWLPIFWVEAHPDPQPFAEAARRLIFLKGTNSHDYKYSSAVFEDYHALAPSLRNRFLAASVFYLRGSGDPDNALVQRTRAALDT